MFDDQERNQATYRRMFDRSSPDQRRRLDKRLNAKTQGVKGAKLKPRWPVGAKRVADGRPLAPHWGCSRRLALDGRPIGFERDPRLPWEIERRPHQEVAFHCCRGLASGAWQMQEYS